MITDPSYNEQELLQQLSEGSEHAFRKLFHAYRDKLYTYIFRLTNSAETAEDTVHEVFLKLWMKRSELPEMYNLSAYLYSIARNKSLNLFRSVARESLMLAELQREEGNTTSSFQGEDRIIHSEVLAMINKAIEQLTPQQRAVFILSRRQEMKIPEIALQLHIEERTVKNHLSSALKSIREEMEKHYGPHAIIVFVLYNLGK